MPMQTPLPRPVPTPAAFFARQPPLTGLTRGRSHARTQVLRTWLGRGGAVRGEVSEGVTSGLRAERRRGASRVTRAQLGALSPLPPQPWVSACPRRNVDEPGGRATHMQHFEGAAQMQTEETG